MLDNMGAVFAHSVYSKDNSDSIKNKILLIDADRYIHIWMNYCFVPWQSLELYMKIKKKKKQSLKKGNPS